MTGLLVSVRNAHEARAAVAGGADIIDVKEPLHGALGAAAPHVWREVRRAVGSDRPLSAALGELDQWELNDCRQSLSGFQFAKLGLAGCANRERWVQDWQRALWELPDEVTRVAVAYADGQAARAPSLDDVITRGAELGCRVLLVDTYDKTQGGLFDHLACNELVPAIDLARHSGMQVVLAGSLSQQTIPLARTLSPDFIAVRGAACRGNRTDCIDASLVHCLREKVRQRATIKS